MGQLLMLGAVHLSSLGLSLKIYFVPDLDNANPGPHRPVGSPGIYFSSTRMPRSTVRIMPRDYMDFPA